jgi:hypothetical protein
MADEQIDEESLQAQLDTQLALEQQLQREVEAKKASRFAPTVGRRIYDNTIGGVGDLYNLFSESSKDPINNIPVAGPAIAALKQLGLGNSIDLIGSGAAQTAGGITGAGVGALTSPVTGPVGPIVGAGTGAAGGQFLYDKAKQLFGVSEDIPASQEAGNFVGDAITNTALPYAGKLLGLSANALNGKLSKPKLDLADPQVGKLINVTESLEKLSPKEAARLRTTGNVTPEILDALSQTQEIATKPRGMAAALQAYRKDAGNFIEQAEKLAQSITKNPKEILLKIDELKKAPDIDSALGQLDDYMNNPEKGLMAEQRRLVDNVRTINEVEYKVRPSDTRNIVTKLENEVPKLEKAGDIDAANELRAIIDNYSKPKSLIVDEFGKPYPQFRTLSDVHSHIKNNNAIQRSTGVYDTSKGARATLGNSSATVTPEKVKALKIEKQALEDFLSDRLDDVYGSESGLGAEAYKEYNASYQTFKPLLNELKQFVASVNTGFVPPSTASLTQAVNPVTQGAIDVATSGKAAGIRSVLNKFFGGQSDRFTKNRADLALNYNRWGGDYNRLSATSDLMSLAENPATLSTFKTDLVNTGNFEKVGMALAYVPKPLLPRNAELSSESLQEAMVKYLSPEEAQAMIQQVEQASASGDETVKKKAYGSLLAAIPELRQEFEPGKTIASSEFDGIIANPIEKKALKSTISADVRANNGSTIEAAKFVSSLNADKKFKVIPKSVKQSKDRVYNMFDNLGPFEPGSQSSGSADNFSE